MAGWCFSFAQNNDVVESINYLKKQRQSPSAYVVSKFSKHSVVLLAEEHAIQNNLYFVKDLIPQLYKAGVTNLGMEFGSVEMQDKVDSLMQAPAYNEQLVRDIMYYHNSAWPYAEYLELYKAVWDFNRTLPGDKKKFRVLHLSYQYNWKGFEGQMTPEKRKKVFSRGGDEYWAGRVKQEVIKKKEKILCLVGVPHAFTRFYQSHADEKGKCRFDSIQFGQHLYREFPKQVFSILLHVPLPGNKGYGHTGNGNIELIMHNLGNTPTGFDLKGTPVGELADSSYVNRCHPSVKMKDLFDGYVFLAPFSQLKGATIDPRFYDGRSWDEVLARQPDPYWFRANSSEDLIQYRRDYANISLRYKNILSRPPLPKVSSGIIQRYENFPSKVAQERFVDVWLPEGYSPKNKYAVLYMHDGQMLFDSTTSWNRAAWDVDDVAGKLMKEGKIRKVIVVGVWNTGMTRYPDYFPRKALDFLPKSKQDSLLNAKWGNGALAFGTAGIQSDNYLKFLVEELKPFIDRTYSTYADRGNTFIGGSSMGGLISMYAICEYPDVFRGAACMSTHWPGSFTMENNPIPDAFFRYLKTNLPDPSTHKIYFDYGDQTLDALYPPLQQKADVIMKEKGFSEANWITKYFPGDAHTEGAWKRRLDVPLIFLLSPGDGK